MDTHIQRSHTLEGLSKRLKTENQMAKDIFGNPLDNALRDMHT